MPDTVLKEILEAAMCAPSANNQQPWQFVVIRDRRTLDAIPTIHPYSGMIREAPLAILVCGDLQSEKHPGFWQQDCAAATQNLLLAVHAKGLAAVWCGCYPREDRTIGLRKLLGIPENVVPMALIPIGYPNEKKDREDRYKEDKVHYDRW